MALSSKLDLGDWIVVSFLVAFSTTGAVWLFLHGDSTAFGFWTGTLTVATGAFHWLRVHDSKVADAPEGTP